MGLRPAFHHTNKEGYKGIMNDRGATLIPDAKNRVFAAQDTYSPAEAEQNLILGASEYAGKGDYVIVFDAPEGTNFVPGAQANEFVNYGTVRVPTSNILYAGPNPW